MADVYVLLRALEGDIKIEISISGGVGKREVEEGEGEGHKRQLELKKFGWPWIDLVDKCLYKTGWSSFSYFSLVSFVLCSSSDDKINGSDSD